MRSKQVSVQLLPVEKDALNGAVILEYLAVIYAWAGEKDLAIKTLERRAKVPGYLSYGDLRLHPCWDQLRGDPRFQKVLASLAPQ